MQSIDEMQPHILQRQQKILQRPCAVAGVFSIYITIKHSVFVKKKCPSWSGTLKQDWVFVTFPRRLLRCFFPAQHIWRAIRAKASSKLYKKRMKYKEKSRYIFLNSSLSSVGHLHPFSTSIGTPQAPRSGSIRLVTGFFIWLWFWRGTVQGGSTVSLMFLLSNQAGRQAETMRSRGENQLLRLFCSGWLAPITDH
jgi:hypothetical protein